MLKFLLVAGLAGAIGFGAGYATDWHQRVDDRERAVRAQVRETISSQIYAANLSLSVLLTLEKGDIAKAKSQLARQVADYQRSWAEYDGVLPGQPKLLPIIQESINHSPTLRQELARISN